MRFVFHYLSYRENREDLEGSGRCEIAEQQWRWQRDESNASLLVRGVIKFWTNLSQLVIWLLPCTIVSAHLCGFYTRVYDLLTRYLLLWSPCIQHGTHPTAYSMHAVPGVAGDARGSGINNTHKCVWNTEMGIKYSPYTRLNQGRRLSLTRGISCIVLTSYTLK